MKYLKKFNESIDFESIISDCEYILSELGDNNNIVGVSVDKNYLFIDIESKYNVFIKLKEYELEFNHLLSFLKSNDYKLQNGSYVNNDTWDPVVFCPNCNTTNDDDIIGDNDYKTKCYQCDYESSSDEFLDFRHMITESDLYYFIKENYWVQYIHLIFRRTL